MIKGASFWTQTTWIYLDEYELNTRRQRIIYFKDTLSACSEIPWLTLEIIISFNPKVQSTLKMDQLFFPVTNNRKKRIVLNNKILISIHIFLNNRLLKRVCILCCWSISCTLAVPLLFPSPSYLTSRGVTLLRYIRDFHS